MPRKLTVPEVKPLVAAYIALPGNSCGGSLHIVLDDENVDDCHVEFCIGYAQRCNDTAGYILALILMTMSKTQRCKLAKTLYDDHV